MKNLIFSVLLYIATTVSAQVSHAFTSQVADYQIATEQAYKVVVNQQTNTFTTQVGAPQLPVFTKSFVLPAGSTVTNVLVSNQSEVLLNGNILLYPTQPPQDWVSTPAFVPHDPAVYNSATPYPAVTVVKSGDGSAQGYHIITLDICPFKYVPLQKRLYLYQTVDITIQYTGGTIEQTEKITKYRHDLNKDWVASRVENPDLLNSIQPTAKTVLDEPLETDKSMLRWKPTDYNNYIPNYIIITNELLKPMFEDLANYKTKRGFTTLVVTTEQIYPEFPGVDNAEKIRNYLKAAHNYWGNGLFILLGGDTEIIPGRFADYNSTSSGPEINPSDLYYSDVYKQEDSNYNWNQNGNNKFGEDSGDGVEAESDSYIGRAAVNTEEEAQNFINKIKKYEKLDGILTNQRNYVNNMLFLGAYYEYPPDPVIYDDNGNIINNGDADGQEWHSKLKNETFLNNSSFKKWLLFDDPQTVPGFQPFPGDEQLNKQRTLDYLSEGKQPDIGMFHLVSHYDHGGSFGIGVSGSMYNESIYREHMDNLDNGNFLQIMYTTACKSGTFTLDSFAEHYINNTNGGGVAILANSGTVNNGYYLQDKKLFQSIYGSNGEHYRMGIAFANARDAYSNTHHRKVLTLFGDPTMVTWSATPQNIIITSATPSSITIDNSTENVLTVTINPIPQVSTVTLYKYNALTGYPEVFSSRKINANSTSTDFHLNPDTPGVLLVTATAKNHLPATKNVNILMPQHHLYVIDYNFEDENENNLIEPGENITLNVVLKNSGGADIESINAVLSNESDLVTITNATATHNPIVAPGGTVQLEGFTFTPSVELGVDEIHDFIEFHLNISGSDHYNHLDNFYLDFYSPKLNLGARTLTPPVIEVGQEVSAKIKIVNSGNAPTGDLTATLTSELVTSGIMEITTFTSAYNDIEISSEEENTLPFRFRLLQAYSGAMPFKLILSNDLGNVWSFTFDMNETQPPLITDFSFTSTPAEINLTWNIPSGYTPSGYNIYRSDSENGTYSKVNEFLVIGTRAYTDYETEEAHEYYYKISVVSPSGNERSLSEVVTQDTPPKQGYKAWTSLEQHGSFPVPTIVGRTSESSPMLYDVDGDGYKEIFLNFKRGTEEEGAIFGYRHDGQEMFNIDGNETTVSGFAITEIAMIPNSAVGDLDKDGHAEVLSIGRNNSINDGFLHVYKTIDEDTDPQDPDYGKPDAFWNTGHLDLGHRAMRNPILYDLDNDGYLEIIIADESQRIHVYDKDKNEIWSTQVGSGDYSLGEIAVADLDNDGYGEIAFGVLKSNGTKGGIYIFNHDGTAFATNPFKEFAGNERADGGITFADIDQDGLFELLTITKNGTTGKIYAFNLDDGSFVDGDWENYPVFTLPNGQNQGHLIPRISVGDINNDGDLEVVFGSKNHLYALNMEGDDLPGFPVENVGDIRDYTPILADIDGDPEIEIIVNTNGIINAYNPDGIECTGWRLQSNNGSPFRGSPSVDDIDNDGLNEIVISSGDCTTYAWDTTGNSDRIEWGSHRADTYNTGTYKKGCLDDIDLYIKDGPLDLGIEPNTFTEHMWVSEDIWIRNENDNSLEHENPEYKSNGQPNYIKVRVINKGCEPSTGTETLTMNWAKANTNLIYPENWDGTLNNGTHPLGGQIPSTPITLPVIQPGEEAVITIPWVVPNPDDYMTGTGSGNPWHFCVLATILGTTDPMTHPYTPNPNTMVRENNNQAWKNLTVVDLVTEKPIGGTVAVSNHSNDPKSYDLLLSAADGETGKLIFEEAEVTVVMDSVMYAAWTAGGNQFSSGIYPLPHSTGSLQTFKVTSDNAKIKNIVLPGNATGQIALRFNVLTEELTSKPKYIYHLIQQDNTTNEVMGGETYEIRKPPRSPFYADSNDVMANRNETVTLVAEDIEEDAVYNWYDIEGNLIYTGTELTVIADIAKTYTLEIIADSDGYKDYADVSVELNPHALEAIVPNPANSSVTVSYNLNAPDSAYLSILGYIGNDTGVERNYILDTESSATTINLTNYAIGFYTIKLICDGQLVGTLNLIKQ